ncbi:MAG: ribonuclease H-like domain-containing protein [Spirochaetota bacterium]
MNLKHKLNIYYTDTGKPVTDSSWIKDAGGKCISTPLGDTITFVQQYNISSLHIDDPKADITTYCTMHHIDKVNLEQCVFFDIETTSLTSGTGNYAFLIGLGYFSGNTFTVEQIFMRQYSDEPALLFHCAEILNKFKTIVTFNGKTFDIPIIKNRYRLNRIQGFPVTMPVIDLLKPARSIFKSIYTSCSLKSLEEFLLGFARTDDVPGYQIPDVYFTYQQTGFDPRLTAVIEHNRIDITSMVLLLVFFNSLYDLIHTKQFDQVSSHLYKNIAKHLYSRNIELFVELIEYAGHALLANDHSLFKKYSTALKRLDHIDRAITFWEKNISFFSLEELAKHYEHKAKDFYKAREYCNWAIAHSTSLSNNQKLIEHYTGRFIHRINRLNRKIQ